MGRTGYLGKSMEGYVFVTLEQALQRRCFGSQLRRRNVQLCKKYRMYGKELESVGHMTSGCTGLAQKEFWGRHGQLGSRVYWELCRKYGVKCSDVYWYKEMPNEVRVLEGGIVEIWWDMSDFSTR